MGGSLEVPGNPFRLAQDRKAARRCCDIEVEGWFGRTHYQGAVVDLSASGLRIKNPNPIKVKGNGVLSVTYPEPIGRVEKLTVECLVKWARVTPEGEQFIGLEYKEPKELGSSWVKQIMQDLGFRGYNLKEQRKELRVNCNFKATVSLGGTSVACTLQNIGLGGVFIEMLKPLRAGATVNLRVLENPHLPGGTYAATVRHQQHPDPSSPFGYGLAFSDLSSEQQAAIEKFVTGRAAPVWQSASDEDDQDFEISEIQDEEDGVENIEIPDLQSILDETEPEEEDDNPEDEAKEVEG